MHKVDNIITGESWFLTDWLSKKFIIIIFKKLLFNN